MTTGLTPLVPSVGTIAAWGLVLGVSSGRAELVVAVLPLLLGLLRIGRTGAAANGWTLARALSAPRVFEGERVTVTVTVSAEQPVMLLELFEPLPPTLRLASGHNRGLFRLRAGESVEWRYEGEGVRPGRGNLGPVHARPWDRPGVRAARAPSAAPGRA